MTGELTHTTSRERNGVARLSYQLSSEKYTLYPLRFIVSYVQPITNQEMFEKHLCNQSSHYEKYGRFLLQREAITYYYQIDTFRCQQR